MLKCTRSLLAALTTLAATGSALAATPQELVVKLRQASDLAALLTEYRLTEIDRFGKRPIYRLRAAADADVEDLVSELEDDERVQYAEPNLEAQAPESSTRRIWAIGGDAGSNATQWAAQALRLPLAHALSTGAGVTVAVLDTGVDASHPALAGRLLPGFDFVDFDADPSEVGRDGDPGYGHGTHVASLVALVAPHARILPLRVLDRHGAGNVWVLAEALMHAVDPDGDPQTDDGARVINMSLGTPRRTELLEDLVDGVSCDPQEEPGEDADDEDDVQRCAAVGGVLVISAAGNTGRRSRIYPAAEEEPGALALSASRADGRLAGYSTRGPWVGAAAPGDVIQGAVPGARWAVWSGSSMAAALASGAAALLRSAYPAWTPEEVKARLVADGRPMCGSTLRQIDPAHTLSGQAPPPPTCP
jgi:subtilisin family serine protease